MNETITRTLSGLVYVIVLLIATSYSSSSFFLLFGVFLLICIYEFCQLIQVNKLLPLLVGATAFALGTYYRTNKTNDILILILTLFVSVKGLLLLFNHKKEKLDTFSKYLFLVGYIILPFIIITKIPFGIRGFNPKIIISIFILIWTNDTFAYVVGKSIGKHKLLEKISPKKTVEGFVGGIVFCVIASYLLSKYYIEATTFIWIIISLIVVVFSTLGDLIESKFKRMAGVKDSGNIMPGHGGMLDRLDSIIFVAPFIFLFYQILYYVS